ncbi:hypothetical protein K8R30_03600 [archaeon]|nr:hypothetical protein [archaeon]
MEKRMVAVLVVTLFLFGFLNFGFVTYVGVPFSPVIITGFAVNDTGIVQLFIGDMRTVTIHSPENTTYDFNKSDPYIIALNVSADFSSDEWRYSLYDLEHDVYVETNILFVPNSSITAVRWGNLLTVSAHETDGEWWNASVIFFVNVSNSAPLLCNISDPILVCEGTSLDYGFNATDVDEDDLVGSISPSNPFYLASNGRVVNMSFFSVISGALGKGDVGNHSESISVLDPFDEVDSKDTTIDVIEINNVPALEDIGAQTVWLVGDDSTFYRVVDVVDVEDGSAPDGNLSFNLTWAGNEDLFDIGATNGTMNYTPVVGHEGSVYSLLVCVEDNALGSTHENISLCAPRGGDKESACDSFTLTVTDENRAPVVVNWTPLSSVFSVAGMVNVGFYAEVYDADGTIPDINWFVDGVLREHNEDISTDTFVHNFGCENGGAHWVEVVTTDGLLDDSQRWDISVSEVECSDPSESGGGAVGGGGYCIENWFCDDWEVCQNVKRSFDVGILSVEDYALAQDVCLQNEEADDRFCGFQLTKCYDLNACNRSDPILERPIERRFCYFTENPSCFDGFTNCHHGECELLVDCGGPCKPCATCSDGIQNQGEGGVDCGGPCPYVCEPAVPFALLSSVLIVLAVVLTLVIIFVLWRLFLLGKKQEDEEVAVDGK